MEKGHPIWICSGSEGGGKAMAPDTGFAPSSLTVVCGRPYGESNVSWCDNDAEKIGSSKNIRELDKNATETSVTLLSQPDDTSKKGEWSC